MSELRQSLIDDRKEAIKNLVQVAGHVLELWYAKEKSGALSRDAAQKGAVELHQLRFADNNYFFAQNLEGVTVLHLDAKLQGKNRLDTVDPDGVRTVVRQIELAKTGGGFLNYRASRTGGTAAVNGAGISPKLAYISGFEPWQWAYGTGIYIDDVDAIYYRIMWMRRFAACRADRLLCRVFRCPQHQPSARRNHRPDGRTRRRQSRDRCLFLKDANEMGRLRPRARRVQVEHQRDRADRRRDQQLAEARAEAAKRATVTGLPIVWRPRSRVSSMSCRRPRARCTRPPKPCRHRRADHTANRDGRSSLRTGLRQGFNHGGRDRGNGKLDCRDRAPGHPFEGYRQLPRYRPRHAPRPWKRLSVRGPRRSVTCSP